MIKCKTCGEEKDSSEYNQKQADCKKCQRVKDRIRYKDNRERERDRVMKWYYSNPNHAREYCAKRRKIDIQFRIKENLRARLYTAIRKGRGGSAVQDLGCTVKELLEYLEQQFLPGMTWENYGRVWTIDHILELCTFDLTDSYQIRKACHYTNLRPLWKCRNVYRNSKKYL